ncbi:MAG TPA: lysoplasmalogenase [Marmoricola sp.]|nr:lysoplasmalogenase [Marmoricola sp.]
MRHQAPTDACPHHGLAASTVTTPTFAASTASRRDGLRRGTLAAQAFSWGGDVALLNSGRRAFLCGVGAFFAAHVGYISAFLSARDRDRTISNPGATAAVASWLLLAPVMSVAAGRRDPRLRLPIALYAGALASMFATSTMLNRDIPTAARRRIVSGSSLFLLSDTLLGIREFLLDDDSPMLDSAVMATYTAGQWLIADGVKAAGRT